MHYSLWPVILTLSRPMHESLVPHFLDPSLDLSLTSVWVKLPNLHLQLWGPKCMVTIINYLGKYYFLSSKNYKRHITTFTGTCAKRDLTKGMSKKTG
jgi:hypothetical protein